MSKLFLRGFFVCLFGFDIYELRFKRVEKQYFLSLNTLYVMRKYKKLGYWHLTFRRNDTKNIYIHGEY